MANSVGDRRGLIPFGMQRRLTVQPGVNKASRTSQFRCDVHDHEIGGEESFVIFVDKAHPLS